MKFIFNKKKRIRSSTKLYELNAKGAATSRFEISGVVNNWVKLR